jgi:hypothetical protein
MAVPEPLKGDRKKEGKKEEGIIVDKDFLKMISDTVQTLKNKIEKLEQGKDDEVLKLKQEIEGLKQLPQLKVAPQPSGEEGAFWCAEISFHSAKTPQELALTQQKIQEFRKKLEQLMKEHRVSQVSASILKKL